MAITTSKDGLDRLFYKNNHTIARYTLELFNSEPEHATIYSVGWILPHSNQSIKLHKTDFKDYSKDHIMEFLRVNFGKYRGLPAKIFNCLKEDFKLETKEKVMFT